MINFNAVRRTVQTYKPAILRSLRHVIDQGIFLNGPENERLEQALVKFLGPGFLTSVASGHDALLLALGALKLGRKDEVIFPVNAYPTAFPVVLSGATPVPVDVDQNGQLDPVALQKAITGRTKAVIAVHLYGLVGNLGEISALCRKYTIALIEDCAQAFGSTYRGRPVGTLGTIGCFSFYPTKNLGALGDGGAVWTKDKRYASYIQAAKAYGERRRYESTFVAGHSRLPELQASVLNVYLQHAQENRKRRYAVRGFYERAIARANLASRLKILTSSSRSLPTTHLFVVTVSRREALRRYLAKRGIETHIHYPQPIHLVPAFSFLNIPRGAFPVAEQLSQRILSLPFHPYMKQREVHTVVNSIKNFYGKAHR